MGDYADMCRDSEFNDYYDRVQGCGIYEDQSLIDDWDDSLESPDFIISRLKTKSCWEIKEIIAETEKSYLIESVKTNNKYWISKKLSQIKGNYIFIDLWYAKKLEPIK